jgi:hypothetical protein
LTRSFIRWPLIVGAGAVGLAACAAYAAYVKAPHVTVQQREAAPVESRPAAVSAMTAQAAEPPRNEPRARYADAIREDMFGGTKPLEAPPAQPPAAAPRQIVPGPAPSPPDPTSDAVYAGCMSMHGRTVALIESRTTREGTYVGEGDTWKSLPVVDVSPRAVTFTVNGAERTVPISDAINVVQLSASAPGTVSSPADQAKLDKKARKAVAKVEKKRRAAIKKAEKRRKKEEKALRAMEEELAAEGNQ